MVGVAAVEASGRGDFLPGVLELVVIPLAVNLASSAACTIVEPTGRLDCGPLSRTGRT